MNNKEITELIRKMCTLENGEEYRDPVIFKSRLERFEEYILKKFPDESIIDILKMVENFYKIKDLFSWYDSDEFFLVLRKKYER